VSVPAAVAHQASVVAAVWCAIHAGVSIPNGAVLALIPASHGAGPPDLARGLGIRKASRLLLHPLGVPTGKAIGVGLLWYGMTLLVSLIGAPVRRRLVTRRRRRHDAPTAAARRRTAERRRGRH
jgi:hypothetical protein